MNWAYQAGTNCSFHHREPVMVVTHLHSGKTKLLQTSDGKHSCQNVHGPGQEGSWRQIVRYFWKILPQHRGNIVIIWRKTTCWPAKYWQKLLPNQILTTLFDQRCLFNSTISTCSAMCNPCLCYSVVSVGLLQSIVRSCASVWREGSRERQR